MTPSGKTPGRRSQSPSGGRKSSGRPQRASSLGRGVSEVASRRAAAILEVLAGMRTAPEAAATLGISVNHYYQLERIALQAMTAACEPQPKGPRVPSPEKQMAKLQRELERCRRECLRQAALVRATQRAVGLPAVAVSKGSGKRGSKTKNKGRRRRASVRALRAVQTLRKNSSGPASTDEVENRLPERSAEEGTAEAGTRTVAKEPQDDAKR